MRALRVLSAVLALVAVAASPPPTQYYGYSAIGSDRERELETQFLDIPTADGALATVRAFAATVRRAGGPGDYETALALRDQLRDLGFVANAEPFSARIDVPKKLTLALFPNGRSEAIAAQLAGNDSRGIFSRRPPRTPVASPAPGVVPTPTPVPVPPTYFSLAEPPIANDPDTATFAEPAYFAGSADGDIVAPLVYAGHGSANDFVALAAHTIPVKGAVVVLRSGRESLNVVIRRAQGLGVAGAIVYDDPADELVRGTAYPYGPYRPPTAVRRGSVGEGIAIPVIPVSAATAQALLGSLHGPTAPAPWRGGLPVGYPFVRGPAYVHLVVQLTRKQATLWNVSGTLVGQNPEQTVIVGARRDAWVYGATDSAGGLATLVEIARGLGFLAKAGFRPERSITVIAFDGEEFGEAGTIAYLRKHGDEVRYGNVAYLDVARPVTGAQFGASVVAPIAYAIADATKAIDDPGQPGISVFQRWALRARTMPLPQPASLVIEHSAVLFGSGVPTATASFSGPFGTSHSAYDTVQFATSYADPDFAYHRAAAQLDGVIALRLADAPVLPYRFSAFLDPLQAALRGVVGAARAAKVTLDRKGLDQSVGRFRIAAARFDNATARVNPALAPDRALEAVRILDVALYGGDTYGVARLTELTHAVADGDPGEVDRATARLRATLDHASDLLAF